MDDRAAIEVLATLDERVAPAHAALLVVDMQNDYCTAGGAGDRSGRDLSLVQAIVPPIRGTVEAARAAGVRVIWAKYTLGPGIAGLSGPEILRRGRNFANADATVKGTWGHEIVDDLPYRRDEDLVVEKRRVSCFVATDFDLCLRGLGIKTLVVAGCTNKEIASKFTVSEETIKHHLTRIFDKVGASNRLELAVKATHSGLTAEF